MTRLLPTVALDHVGIAAEHSSTALTSALDGGSLAGRQMPSGVAVGRFGPHQALELVWPARPRSPIEGFLARRGPGLHHVALRVDAELEALRARLAAAGLEVIGNRVEPSADGRPCLFLHPRCMGGVLTELVQGAPRRG